MAKKITAIQRQKRNRNRVNVYLDEEYAFGLTGVVAGWLQVGQELSTEKINELKAEDAVEVAYQRALNFLSYRPRAEREVIRNLKKHDTDEAVVEAVMERLRRHDYVNDEHFAELWIENRSEFRPRGRYALRTELRQKGLPDDVIEAALEDLDEPTLALRAAMKQARKYTSKEWQDFRSKMNGFLARRGFSYEIISSVIPEVWEAQQQAAEQDNTGSGEDDL